MKRFIKTLLIAGSLLLATLPAVGGLYSTNAPVGTNVLMGTTVIVPMEIYQLTVVATNHQAYFTLYDNATGTNAWQRPAYVSYTTYATNHAISNYSVVTGLTNWWTNSAVYTLPVTNAAGAARIPARGVFTAPANSSVTYDVSIPILNGVTVEQTTNCGIFFLYRPLR